MDRAIEKLRLELKFLADGDGPVESAMTASALRIFAGETCLTANDNRWERRNLDEIFVSAYPLAAWFASSWWRLRWEPGSDVHSAKDWTMYHWMASANEGYLWPNIRFESMGEFIELFCEPSPVKTDEMVRFLVESHRIVSGKQFESAIDDFIAQVLTRLTEQKLPDTELHALWREVKAERNDARLSKLRRLEAMAGFEAGSLDKEALQKLEDLENAAGKDSAAEVAAACGGRNPLHFVDRAITLARKADVSAMLPILGGQIRELLSGRPWEEGENLAQHARTKLGLGKGRIDNRRLSALLNLSRNWQSSDPANSSASLGVAVRQRDSEGVSLVFRKKSSTGRRFELARFLGDSLWSPDDQWLPETDSKTARQKRQRAFAIEFLCPYDELARHIPDYPTDRTIRSAAKEFEVSPLAVASQLVNHARMSSDRLAEYKKEASV